MKFSLKRILSFALALVMILGMVPSVGHTHVHAEEHSVSEAQPEAEMLDPIDDEIDPYQIMPLTAVSGNLSVNGLGAEWEYTSTKNKNGSVTASGNSITVVATAGLLNKTKIKLTLTNNLGEAATLKFNYSKDSGSLTGSISEDSGSYEAVLESGKSIEISFEAVRNNTSTLNIDNISLISTTAADPTITFNPGVNGTYTVNGTAVTAVTAMTVDAGAELKLVATPNSGYQFFGWQKADGTYLSQDSNFTLTAGQDETVTPVFIDASTALFGVGTVKYDDLTKAGAAAAAGTNKTIILLNNGTVSGTHTIPKGTTLLIPYDDANTAYGANASCTSYSSYITDSGHIAWETPTAYRTLTLAADAKITVNGNIEVGGRHAAAGGKTGMYGGSPTGKLGYINMLSGSHIDLNSGANLYCWGYVYGDGTITAKNGAAIYENFQIMDFRGGSVTSQLATEFLVFPLSQYYVQNVEVATTYEYGSTEYIATSIFLSNMCHSATVKFIGTDAMFQPESGSYFVKDYNPATDMLEMHAYGNSAIASMNLELGGTAIDSSAFVLPITNNISINLHSGITTIKQNIMMLPGSSLTLDEGAVLNLAYTEATGDVVTAGGYVIQIFDSENWTKALNMDTLETVSDMNFVHPTMKFRAVQYTCTTRKNRTEADLTDVTFDINGEVISNGFLYSTVTWADPINEDLTVVSGGANVISSKKTGKVTMVNGAGQDMLGYMYDQSRASYYFVPLASVQLKNGDGSMLDTSGAGENTTYAYCAIHDCWYTGLCEDCAAAPAEYTITWQINGKTYTTTTVAVGAPITAPSYTVPEGHDFSGWSFPATMPEGDQTYNATLTKKSFQITWNMNGNKVTQDFYWNDKPEYTGTINLPDAPDNCHYYQFIGWATTQGATSAQYGENDLPAVTGDATYYAVYELVTNSNHNTTVFQYTANNNGTHKKVLACCGELVNATETCSGGTATCEGKPVCQHCRAEYGTSNGHAFNSKASNQQASAADCDNPATYYVQCDNCDAVDTSKTVAVGTANGHAFNSKASSQQATPADCDNPATYYVQCDNCDAVDTTKTVAVGTANGHAFNSKASSQQATPADCDNPATYYVQCDNCDAVDTSKTVAVGTANGHAFNSKASNQQASAADCNNPATYYVQCDNCDAVDTSKTVAVGTADGHSYIQNLRGSLKTPGTCVSKAVYAVKCDNCDHEHETLTVKGELGDHTYGELIPASEAVHTATELKGAVAAHYHCACGKYFTEEFVETTLPELTSAAPVHAHDHYATTADTHQSVCVCGATIGTAEGHKGGTATCKAAAVCSVCDTAYGSKNMANHVSDEIRYLDFGDTHAVYHPCCETYEEDTAHDFNNAEHKCVCGAVETFNITWDLNGGKWIGWVRAEDSAEFDEYIQVNTAPNTKFPLEREGYTFIGFKDQDGNVYQPELTSAGSDAYVWTLGVMPGKDITLTAQWQVNQYTITWIVDGKETTSTVNHGETPVFTGSTEKADTAEWDYTFTGWSPAVVAATCDATYTAQYSQVKQTYTVTWTVNGEKYAETAVTYGEAVTAPAYEVPEGHTFSGWTVPETMPAENITLDATLTVNVYSITFLIDGQVHSTGTLQYGAAIPVPNVADREGYTFSGWGEVPATMPAHNVVINGYWTVNTYTLTIYDWMREETKIAEIQVSYGAALMDVLNTVTVADIQTDDGVFSFAGTWLYKVGQEDCANVDETTTMPASDFTVYAEFVFTGWQYGEDGVWYVVKDETQHGWKEIDGATYYLDTETGYRAEGITLVEEKYHNFAEDGKYIGLYTGVYTDELGDTYYIENGVKVANKGLVRVYENGEAKYYYFGCSATDNDSHEDNSCDPYKAQKNCAHWVENTNGLLPAWDYTFGADGVIVHDDALNNNEEQTHAVVKYEEVKFYTIDGIKVHYGLFIGEDGEYYYAKSNGELVAGRAYWISESHLNGVERNGEPVAEGSYTFDAEGRIVWPDADKDGVFEEGGKLYYYVDGERTYAGLIQYTGVCGETVYNNDWIYVRTNGELATGMYWTTKHNGHMAAASYEFDAWGRMVRENGIVEKDGVLYYYENGLPVYAGLIEIDGSYYYVRTNGQLAIGNYWITKTNGLMPEATYNFDESGKMTNAPEKSDQEKNGIYAEDGGLFYYVKGVRTYAGLIEIDGSYYYVRTNGQVAIGSYWITKTNGLMKQGMYTFDENGVMLNPSV